MQTDQLYLNILVLSWTFFKVGIWPVSLVPTATEKTVSAMHTACWSTRGFTCAALRPVTILFGLGMKLWLGMRTKLENGDLSNGQQPHSLHAHLETYSTCITVWHYQILVEYVMNSTHGQISSFRFCSSKPGSRWSYLPSLLWGLPSASS